MSKHKYKKDIKLFEAYKDTIIGKGAKEEIKHIKRRYQKHRNKSLPDENKQKT
jgi:hypothetical protein